MVRLWQQKITVALPLLVTLCLEHTLVHALTKTAYMFKGMYLFAM